MTLEEIAYTLPNGFHDAQINSISINYLKREITLDLEIWVADSEEDDSDIYRLAELKLLQFLFLIIVSRVWWKLDRISKVMFRQLNFPDPYQEFLSNVVYGSIRRRFF